MTGDDLRRMVREVLREVVPPRGAATTETVRIASDADLMAFAHRVIAAQAAVTSGALRFTLGAAPTPAASQPGAAVTGVITESVVNRHAGAGRILLAPGAVVTPLARDRARALNLKLERSR